MVEDLLYRWFHMFSDGLRHVQESEIFKRNDKLKIRTYIHIYIYIMIRILIPIIRLANLS